MEVRIWKTAHVVEVCHVVCEGPALDLGLEGVHGHRNACSVQGGDDRLQAADLFSGRHRTCLGVAGRRPEVDRIGTLPGQVQGVRDRTLGVEVASADGKGILGQIDDAEDPAGRQMTPSAVSVASVAASRPSSSPYTSALCAPRRGAPPAIRPGVREKRG
jgi:hypothetical protein